MVVTLSGLPCVKHAAVRNIDVADRQFSHLWKRMIDATERNVIMARMRGRMVFIALATLGGRRNPADD